MSTEYSCVPLQQGDLDGLCGLYACCNAFNNVEGVNLSLGDLHNIFQVGLKYIEKTTKGGAYKAITEGITGRTMGGMLSFLAEAVTKNTPYSLSVHSLRDDITNLKGFWEAAEACTECGGTIIMAVAGDKRHWTCVNRVTKNRLWCCDSDGLQWLNRKQCTMKEMHDRRINELNPYDFFAVMRSDCVTDE